MHKVDSSGATAQNEFTDGGGATPRTRLEAKFMNAVQRELVAIPTARGLTLSSTDDQQLLQCLLLHVADVAGLRAMPVPSVPGTQTVGVFVRDAGAGLARLYAWSSTSSTADNGGTVIRPSSNPATGRWLSISMMDAGTTSSVAWASVTGKPTTIVGYGITDMGSQSVNYANSAGAVAWSGVTGKPTTLAGYGITDHSWSNLTGKPTTVAGYNIADMGAQSVNYANSAGAVPWSGVTGRPNTVAGFGISDMGSQSVAYAANAGRAHPVRGDGAAWDLNWSGQGGQPSWLVGSNDGSNFYVWNPSNFSVNYANTAGYSGSSGTALNASTQARATNNSTIATTAFVQDAYPGGANAGDGGDVTAARAVYTTYTNPYGRPFELQLSMAFDPNGDVGVVVDGTERAHWRRDGSGNGLTIPFSIIIPKDATYYVAVAGTASIAKWSEL